MNSGTLIGSLIFSAVLVMAIAVTMRLMVRGWRRRSQWQAELIGELPDVPSRMGAAAGTLRGIYVGCTLPPAWNDRITAGDLGYRSTAVLTRFPGGILLERTGAQSIWMPQTSITAVRTERGMAGKVVARDSILAIRWRLPSGVEIDTGFRANDRSRYDDWLEPRTEDAA